MKENPQQKNLKKLILVKYFFVEDEQEYGENPYMRIFEMRDIDEDYFNAVDLGDGRLVYLNDNEPIILCSATLKIY